MKKNCLRLLLLLALAALVAFAMMACNTDPGTEETTVGDTEATEAPTDPETEAPTE